MEKIVIVSARQQVVEALKKDIVSGNLKPCQPLYERDLAEKLGVSRTPIREALQVLAAAGFIETKSRIGWSVSMPDVKSIGEILELRTILETAGAEIVLNGKHEFLRRDISSLFDPITIHTIDRSIDQYLEVDDRFHKSLINVTNNAKIIEIYDNIALWIDWVRHFISHESPRSRSLEEHQAICEAMKRSDLKETQKALKAHIKRVGDEFTFHLNLKGAENSGRSLEMGAK